MTVPAQTAEQFAQDVGRDIAALRRRLGLNQTALGRRVGVSRNTVNRWELGQKLPDIWEWTLLKKALRSRRVLTGGPTESAGGAR